MVCTNEIKDKKAQNDFRFHDALLFSFQTAKAKQVCLSH